MLCDAPEPVQHHVRSSLPPDVAQRVHVLSKSSLVGCTSAAAYQLLHAQAPDVLPAALDMLGLTDQAAPLADLVCAAAPAGAPAACSVLTRLTGGARPLPAPWLLATSWVLHPAWSHLTQQLGVFYDGLSLRSAAAGLRSATPKHTV
ncbi:hypothetical protein CHLRE_16g669126v5 [Chlamydomonas reinhardtii]|uniref:Uncharacterized protein n=1 Tax=Chlamydomonas reinhardtii TaxID=3055 RepID=A0A2K3CUD0_CHLRE|nr:uncharacterized protein CHLRE_16g669126v5 [Chlamydomonas reinhardtii]PNW71884.1 hypothetical protein CHLRE_16g669126v5 [Chlamydomonas reinhardtii]